MRLEGRVITNHIGIVLMQAIRDHGALNKTIGGERGCRLAMASLLLLHFYHSSVSIFFSLSI